MIKNKNSRMSLLNLDVILVPSHMITLCVHTVSVTVYILAFTFTLYIVPCRRLSKDNRTWSCSVGATTLSVSVESHDSLTLYFELQPCSRHRPLASFLASTWNLSHHFRIYGTLLALAFRKSPPPFLASRCHRIQRLASARILCAYIHSGFAWLLPDLVLESPVRSGYWPPSGSN